MLDCGSVVTDRAPTVPHVDGVTHRLVDAGNLVAVTSEQTWNRVRPAAIAMAAAAVLHLIALVRYADDVDWDRPVAWLLVGYLVSVLATGAYGWSAQRDRGRASHRNVAGGGGGTA